MRYLILVFSAMLVTTNTDAIKRLHHALPVLQQIPRSMDVINRTLEGAIARLRR